MAAAGGDILYKQESDRFIIEYDFVYAIPGTEPQWYQIILFFSSGNIEIRYDSVTAPGIFNPNAHIGIQWAANEFINYDLARVDRTKALKFIRTANTTQVAANFVYKTAITPELLRTFSIHLKRLTGGGDIKYTLDGGDNWQTISPPLTTDWTRYAFPSTRASQQIGIEIETLGDAIFA
jgi:hypothetical protein